MYHLRPLTTYSSPSRVIRVRMLRGVGAGDVRLGHREARPDPRRPAAAAATAPAARGCRTGEQLHVAGVRRRAVEHLGADDRPAGQLGERRVLQVGQPGAPVAVRHEEVPQPLGAGLLLQLRHHRRQRVRVGGLGELPVVHGSAGIDVLVHEGPQPVLQFARCAAENSKSTVVLVSSGRGSRRQRGSISRDGGRQPFLVGVVVPALAVPAQVVAHDRGHLHPAQRAEPARGRRRGRPSAAYAASSSSAVGQAGDRAADAGEVAASAKSRNQPRSTRGSPTLQISQSTTAAGSVAAAEHVAEPEVAVHQRGRDARAPTRRAVGAAARRRHAARRDGGHGAAPPAQLAARATAAPRRPAARRAVRRAAGQHPGGAQHPGRGQRRRAPRGRRAPARAPRRPRTPSRTRPARSRRSATIAGHRHRRSARARAASGPGAACRARPTGRWPGGTALTT